MRLLAKVSILVLVFGVARAVKIVEIKVKYVTNRNDGCELFIFSDTEQQGWTVHAK